MRILSFKPGHDGSIALIDDGRLIFSIEAEKDSFDRYGQVTASTLIQAAELTDDLPDVIALGGWHRVVNGQLMDIGAGYFGPDRFSVRAGLFFGKEIRCFTSSHERSHLFGATALFSHEPVEECVILTWEGQLGTFYHWSDFGNVVRTIDVLPQPGARYASLFALADPSFPDEGTLPPMDAAGKLMALAGHATSDATEDERQVVDSLLNAQINFYPFYKTRFRQCSLYNRGVDTPPVHRAARYLTNRLFDVFRAVALTDCPRNVPLLISGGCGLNCEWNTAWVESGLFASVFVPPCANDSGSAIGTAADAYTQLCQKRGLEWSVYAGAYFCHDMVPTPDRWHQRDLDLDAIAAVLAGDEVVAWVQGRYEIGPRALGHRSLLASPLHAETKSRLNQIKGRESYRPIAPCCLVEDLNIHFATTISDPYMLHLASVRHDRLPATTHADGTARVQAVGHDDEPTLYRLLQAFRAVTGVGVLCNTSLNYKGTGFINSMSHLVSYCETNSISHFAVDNVWYQRAGAAHSERASR